MDQADKDFELLDFVEFFGEEDWLQSDDATSLSSTSTACNVRSVFNSFRDPSSRRPPNGTRKKRRKARQVSRCKVVVSRAHTPSTSGDRAGRGAGGGSSSGDSVEEGSPGPGPGPARRVSAEEEAALRKQFRRASFILNSILRHYNNGDGGGLGDFYRANCTDNFEYHEYAEDPSTGTDASGKVEMDRGFVGVEAYAKLINDAFEATPDGVLTLYEMALKENGKLVVCKCTVAGTIMAPFEFPDGAHEVARISSAASEAVAKVDTPAASLLVPVVEHDGATASELPPVAAADAASAPTAAATATATAMPRGAPMRYSANGTLAFTLDPVTDKIARIDSHFHVPTTVMLTVAENSALASAAASAATSRAGSLSSSGKH